MSDRAAPWNLDPATLHMRRNRVEKRLSVVEGILGSTSSGSSSPNPEPPSMPPPGAFQKALSKLKAHKGQLAQLNKATQLHYDFLLEKFPAAVETLEGLPKPQMDSPSSTPPDSAAGARPTHDEHGDEYDEFADEIHESGEESAPIADEAPHAKRPRHH